MNRIKSSLLIHTHPDLLTEWDYNKNNANNINVNTITYGSHVKAWWKCSQYGHSFEAIVRNRTHGSGCPYCTGKKVLIGFNDLQTCYPNLVESEWDWSRNTKRGLYPTEVSKGSKKKAWWHCSTCKGSYEATICDKTTGYGCPFCAGHKVLPGFNDLLTLYPELIESEWDYVKNDADGLFPNMLSGGSEVNANWKCGKCNGSYLMSIKLKTIMKCKCPYCDGKRVLAGFNDLLTLYPELIASEWDWAENDNHGLKPDMLTSCSNMIAYWKCMDCNNSYDMAVKMKVNGSGCPYCTGKRVLPGFNDLESKYPELMKEWNHDVNIIKPDSITVQSHVRVSWKCSACSHEWFATVNHRVNGSGCPACAKRISKQENQVADFIKNYLCKHYGNMSHTMHRSIKFKKVYEMLYIDTENVLSDDLQSHLLKELDIYIPELSLAIEYDGDYWHSNEVMLKNKGMTNIDAHMIKQELCKQAGIDLLIITEHDWLHDTVNVKNTMITLLNEKMNYMMENH